MDLDGLQGKVVVITGASSGIGAALAKAFSKNGARVTLAARREERLLSVADDCPGESLILKADITDPNARQAIVAQTIDRWGRIDILVNNAGLGAYGHFLETSEEQWRHLFEVNLFAPVFLTQAVIPAMQARGRGIIINVVSIGGLIAHSDKVTAYVASKHALIGFSRGLAKDLASAGIRVLAVCPHLTDTDFFSVSQGAQQLAFEVEKYRDFMDTPEEVAQGILNQIDSSCLVVFPTVKPAKVYEKQRDI
jgi:short-subunit dehydrogenase